MNCVQRVRYLKHNQTGDRKDKSFNFRIIGDSDSDYEKCTVTRRSVSSFATFLEGEPVMLKGAMKNIVAL